MSALHLSRDAKLVLLVQSLRAFAYGFGAILVGATLRARQFSAVEIGLVLGDAVAGIALASMVIARYELSGGCLNLPGLTIRDPNAPPQQEDLS